VARLRRVIHMGRFMPSKECIAGKGRHAHRGLALQTRVDPCLWRVFEMVHHGAFYINSPVHRCPSPLFQHLCEFLVVLLLARCFILPRPAASPERNPPTPLTYCTLSTPPRAWDCPCAQLHINTHRPPCFHPNTLYHIPQLPICST
jgi:hypothetical protein